MFWPSRIQGLVLPILLLCDMLTLHLPAGFCDEEPAPEKLSLPAPARDQTVKADHGSHFRLGGISVGAGFTYHSGPYAYPGYRLYDPYWSYGWYPWWGSYPAWDWEYPLYSFPSRTTFSGEIKLQCLEKDAEVFIDGAFAGIAEDLKSFWLDPGVYDLEIKNFVGAIYQKRLYVLSGKRLKVTPVLKIPQMEE